MPRTEGRSELAWPPLDRASGDLEGQIYRLVRERVLAGQLLPGQRLPSTRALAGALEVARSTVVHAYERLRNEGYLQTTAGALCRVSGLALPVFSERPETPPVTQAVPARISGRFELGVPDLASFPHKAWARTLAARARALRVHDLGYGQACGLEALRVAILDHVAATRGVTARPEQVLVVPSTRAAVSLLAEVLLRDVRDDAVVWVEDPGYPTAKTLLSAAGAVLLPVPCDEEGIDVARAPARAPRLIYVTPSHQYPMGYAMSLQRRVALLAAARRHNAIVLEDDYDSEFRYGSRPIAALQGIDRGDSVVYLGTFSKTLAPGLRVAYAIVPPALTAMVAEAQLLRAAVVPVHIQAALADFMCEGQFRAHLRRMNAIYGERMAATVEALRRHGEHLFRIGPGAGGLQLAAWFHDERIVDAELAKHLKTEGFAVRPLSSYYLLTPRPGLVFGIATEPAQQIDALIAQLVRSVEKGVRST
ncbi:MAG TPA: PLP-dependent aminotransferase family protein [Dyella sp.]|uniref:MocR-like pyridoxine biosynthesis transcription factor PdxR n=1 Tax=Dyella sp. TaxID=1869338 RepID=UPI002F91EEFC